MYKIILLFTLLTLGSFSIPLPDEKETLVIKTAQDNLPVFLSKIPIGQENYYGFNNRDEFIKSSVGKPFRMITLTDDFYKESLKTNKDYILLKNEWRIPITINGENRILLTVIQKDTSLEVVDLGGSGLAKELQQKETTTSDEFYLLRIYPLTIDFLVRGAAGVSLAEASYIPLASATKTLNNMQEKRMSGIYTMAEVLQMVKQQLKDQSKN